MQTRTEIRTKSCPMCGEQILMGAQKCKHCGEYLNPSLKKATQKDYKWTPGRIILLIIGLAGLGALLYGDLFASLPTLFGK